MIKVRPRVAVVIPFFGREAQLRVSLQSLAREQFPHDIIIVDDGNTTPASRASDWQAGITLLRLVQNSGPATARNTGLRQAIDSGYQYIATLDAGDEVVGGRLEKQVAFLDSHEECKMVGAYAVFNDLDGRALFEFRPPCSPAELLRELHRKCCFLQSTVMFRSDVFAESGFYRDTYPAAEDYDIFFRIGKLFPTANIPEILLKYEVNPLSDSARRRKLQVASRLRIVLANFDFSLIESY
jgi:glycosyltransferase involved in cell wall biosynthesis